MCFLIINLMDIVRQVLKFNLMESGLLSVFPWMTMAISANAGGWIADTLVSRCFSVTNVRKVPVYHFFSSILMQSSKSDSFDNHFILFYYEIQIMQTIGFLGPAFFLTQLKHIDSPTMAVLCMACSQGTDAFSQSGLYSNHQDIAPRYSVSVINYSQVLINHATQKQID